MVHAIRMIVPWWRHPNLRDRRVLLALVIPGTIFCYMCAVLVQSYESPVSAERLMGYADGLPSKEERAKNRKIILFWTKFFGGQNSYLGEEGKRLNVCRVSECILTDDRSLWNSSDALIFHPLDFDSYDVPPVRHEHQYYIYFVLESPHHSSTGPVGFFNLTFTYRLDSDIMADNYLQYFRLPLWTGNEMETVWRQKTKLVVMFASNCGTPSDRDNYVKVLQRYLPVDVYGACGTLQCPRRTKEKCDNLVGQYKFYLAFENSICRDYITEKAVRPYLVNTIPVFLGGTNYSTVFPSDSFIDARDYRFPKHLAEELLRISESKEEYAKYFEFRRRKPTNPHNNLPPHLAPDNVSLCKLCTMLHAKQRVRKVYENLQSWWIDDGQCLRPDWLAQSKNLI